MAVVHAVEDLGSISDASSALFLEFQRRTYDTHALPGSDECCNTNHEANGREYSPAATSITESDENGTDDTAENAGNTETTSENDTGSIAVANGPSNEVRVGLMT